MTGSPPVVRGADRLLMATSLLAFSAICSRHCASCGRRMGQPGGRASHGWGASGPSGPSLGGRALEWGICPPPLVAHPQQLGWQAGTKQKQNQTAWFVNFGVTGEFEGPLPPP